jgi:hypothetical protein
MRGGCAALVLVVIACGGSSGTEPREPTSPAGGKGSSAARPAAAAPDAKLTADECGAMLDHIIEVGWAEQKRTLPPEKVPTPDQIAEIKKQTREKATQPCLSLPRPKYDCAMAAREPDAIVACEEAP